MATATITQTLEAEIGRESSVLFTWTVSTRDASLRAELVALGWTPPAAATETAQDGGHQSERDTIRELHGRLQIAGTERDKARAELAEVKALLNTKKHDLNIERELRQEFAGQALKAGKELTNAQARLAAVKKETAEGLALCESERGVEKFSGNIVKEEYWKGEAAAYHRVRRAAKGEGEG